MATDLAEFLGAIVALYLLFHIPMLIGAVITGVITYAILALHRYGFRTMETVIGSIVAIIAVCYVVETLLAKPDWNQVLYHSIVPWLGGPSSVLLAVGIVGATVMPHAIYLHSALTQDRIVPRDRRAVSAIVRFSYIDVIVALTIAGMVNLAMMYMAAAVFQHDRSRRRRRHHDRVSHAHAAARQSRRRRLSALAPGLGYLELGRGNDGRTGHHAEFRGLHGTALAPPPRDDAAGARGRCTRRQRDAGVHLQSGCA